MKFYRFKMCLVIFTFFFNMIKILRVWDYDELTDYKYVNKSKSLFGFFVLYISHVLKMLYLLTCFQFVKNFLIFIETFIFLISYISIKQFSNSFSYCKYSAIQNYIFSLSVLFTCRKIIFDIFNFKLCETCQTWNFFFQKITKRIFILKNLLNLIWYECSFWNWKIFQTVFG